MNIKRYLSLKGEKAAGGAAEEGAAVGNGDAGCWVVYSSAVAV